MCFASTTSSFESNIPRFRNSWLAWPAVLAAALLCGASAEAQHTLPIDPDAWADEPVFSVPSPIGALEYHTGRGLRFGDTGLTIGGFTTVEIDDEEHGDATIELDSISLLILYQPIDRLRFFGEFEVGGLARLEPDKNDFDQHVHYDLERLYIEWNQDDALNLRVGKFQTPVGRWNLVPAEPFVWTAADPVTLDIAFDEHQTGVALFGTFYPGRTTLRYWLYGQTFDPLDRAEDPLPASRSAGGRLEWSGPLNEWSLGTSLLASKRKGDWQYLLGLDAVLRVGPLELTSEAYLSEGGLPDRDLWSVYLQGVYDLRSITTWLRNVYFVARYEHFQPDEKHQDADLWDLGFTWLPTPWLNLKAFYRLTDRVTDDVTPGISASISVLF